MNAAFAGLVSVLLSASAPKGAMTVQAKIDAKELRVGGAYELVLDVSFEDGWSGAEAGVPAPILQIDPPPAVKLTGNQVKGYKALARNEFLQEPFERTVAEPETRIGFQLVRKPSPDERLGLNVVAYVRPSGSQEAYFVRRRVELPLSGEASATGAPSDNSRWGNEKLLHIGDQAPGFTLPRADGSKLDLAEVLARNDVIVTTYRAFW